MLNFLEGAPQVNRIYGVVVGIVIDNKHPDGEYRVAFEVAWEAAGETEKVFGEVEVVVGEGTGGDLTCNSMVMVAAASVLAFSLLMVQRRR